MAQKMGTLLGRGENLFRPLPGRIAPPPSGGQTVGLTPSGGQTIGLTPRNSRAAVPFGQFCSAEFSAGCPFQCAKKRSYIPGNSETPQDRIRDAGPLSRAINMITGPSSSGDIEQVMRDGGARVASDADRSGGG
jgi:hypothetical protein